MKKINVILSILLVIAIFFGGAGCMANFDFFKNTTREQAEMAEKMLYEKYGEEFVVESLGGRWGTATDGYYTCNCYPKNNESLKFQVTVDKDYTSFSDEYITKIGELELKKYLIDELKDICESPRILVSSRNQIVDSVNTEISVDEFIELCRDTKIYIKVVVDEQINTDELTDKLTTLLLNYDSLTSQILIYSADGTTMANFDEWYSKYDKYDHDCEEILNSCSEIEVQIKQGEVIN